MDGCTLCPRQCNVDRSQGQGFCGQDDALRVARIQLHVYEEPCISGVRGSGTVFFPGCTLRCAFCQNRAISREESTKGEAMPPQELALRLLRLQDEGAHNVNLVTPTHMLAGIRRALELVKPRLHIPVVYNTSGYERTEMLRTLEGLVDVYLPDFKYCDPQLAMRYSQAPDYPEIASRAITEMHRQAPTPRFGEDGILEKGLLIRHLVLPGCRKDSIAVLNRLRDLLTPDAFLLSLMSQYTPDFAMDSPHRELHRRITTFEYQSVLNHAITLGFHGYMQEKSAASASYTPDF